VILDWAYNYCHSNNTHQLASLIEMYVKKQNKKQLQPRRKAPEAGKPEGTGRRGVGWQWRSYGHVGASADAVWPIWSQLQEQKLKEGFLRKIAEDMGADNNNNLKKSFIVRLTKF